jgi:hypothetical protein
MSLGRRILNIARAELNHALRTVVHPRRSRAEREAERRLEEELRRTREEGRGETGSAPRVEEESALIRRYYANLELPFGATASEVRAAYRRLIRRYHPDRHHGDQEAAKTANELTQRLRVAHDGLLAHLERRTER